MGTLMRNTEPHQKCSSNKPPTTGPNATAAPDTADHTPIAFARSTGSVNTFVMIASVAGNTSAAPTPIAPRQKIRLDVPPEKAAIVEHAAKMARPTCSAPLRPKRSPMPPPARRSPANTRLYESTIHCSADVPAFSSRESVGRATFTIRLSTTTMKSDRQRTARMRQRRA